MLFISLLLMTSLNFMKSARRPRAIDSNASPFHLRIGRSRIRGLGVFAEENIPARRKIIEYTGERITRKTLESRMRKILRRGGWGPRYLFRVNRNCFIDAHGCGCGSERINHSCDPNLTFRRIRGRIFFFSLRRIPRGQELTLDYRYRPDGPQKRCLCGSPKCRGTINLSRPAKS